MESPVPDDTTAVSFEFATPGLDCSDVSITGLYVQDKVLDSADNLSVAINVKKPGEWHLATDTANGFGFEGAGQFQATGLQSIVIYGKGKPRNSGKTTITIKIGERQCNFVVDIETPPNVPDPPANVMVLDSVVFSLVQPSSGNRYFSTVDNTFSTPFPFNNAQTVIDKIDLVYTFNPYNDYGPGFIDPVTASKQWYWDYDYLPWLSTGVQTLYFITELTKPDFDLAKKDPALLEQYFDQTKYYIVQAPHSIYPTGSCIGGRGSNNIDRTRLNKGTVFGFMNAGTKKKGLLYVRNDQVNGWPSSAAPMVTKVDIIKQR